MRRTIASRHVEDSQMEANRVTASLAGLGFMLALVIVGLLLMRHMRDQARVEDCLMAGRINCAPLVTGAGATAGPPRYLPSTPR